MNRCDLLQVKIQPTDRSGMGLKAKFRARVTKSCGANQRINIRRSIKQGGMGLRAIKPKQGDEEIYTKSIMLGFYRGF